MQNVDAKPASILDRSFASLLRWDAEKLLWAVLLILTVLSRVIGLGDRAMSHDESLHTVYSWQLYDGRGYQHQPMMHGPLKFILNALAYFTFGVDDWSSRIQVAIFGIALVWLAYFFKRWMGKAGAFATGLMLAISPALLYYSRYIRDEVMLCTLLVLLALCMFRYMESRSAGWLIATAATLAFAFLTMEASFIFGGVFGGFLVLALAVQLWVINWPRRRRSEPAHLLPGRAHRGRARIGGRGALLPLQSQAVRCDPARHRGGRRPDRRDPGRVVVAHETARLP